jgi:amino acid adenylation domain-containing protein
LFEDWASRSPESIAIVSGDRTLSYGALNARANRMAHALIAAGVKPDDRVALCMERSPEMVVAMLAILKAGGGYVPIDPGYPDERLAYLLGDCAPAAILCAPDLRDAPWLSVMACPILDIDTAAADQREENPAVAGMTSRRLAYVIYTSGSTGMPKGVEVEHHSIMRLVMGTDYAPIGESDCLAHCSNPAFDASTWEIWGALLHGARLAVVPQHVVLDPSAFNRALIDDGVTAIFMTVGLFNEYQDALAPAFSGLRHLLVGGDALNPRKIERALKNPQRPQRLVNCYGPTETTTFAVTHEVVVVDAAEGSIPLGRPIANTQVYVLDANREPVPVGVTGELYIGGDGVARGYLNRPALTAERFLEDPFSEESGARMYRTGDLGRWRSDGTIEFLGRNDFQVKIRGFRVELGEIEAQLCACDGVREAMVLAREDAPGEKRLVAYYVSEDALDVAVLRERLSRRMPDYMLPTAFVRMLSWPLTANGKLDRRALPAPEGDAYARREYEAPLGAAEESVAAIWRELLGLDQVGRHDNFFELGGHSLIAMQLTGRIRSHFRIDLPMLEIFNNPTLSALAAVIHTQQVAIFMGDDLAIMEEELEGMSEAELLDLLRKESLDG